MKNLKSDAIESVKGLVETVGRALHEPWELTSARLLGSEWMPRLEIRETEKEVVVTASLPEMSKDDLHLSVTEDSLSLRGLKVTKIPARAESEGRRHGRDEDRDEQQEERESFYRSISLPSTVRPDEAKARFKDGELTVTLPKAKHSRVKRVSID